MYVLQDEFDTRHRIVVVQGLLSAKSYVLIVPWARLTSSAMILAGITSSLLRRSNRMLSRLSTSATIRFCCGAYGKSQLRTIYLSKRFNTIHFIGEDIVDRFAGS